MNVRSLLGFALSLTLLPLTLLSQQKSLSVDTTKSEVHFTLADPLHTVNGTFQIQTGSVNFDTATSQMSGGIVVNAASGATGNSTRDKKMTADQLKAPTFATVTFVPHSYTGTLAAAGDSSITVAGTFTMLGTPHEITVPMQVHIDGSAAKATGSFDIPYVQWGMKDPSNFLLKVGKNVTVNLVLVGTIAPQKTS